MGLSAPTEALRHIGSFRQGVKFLQFLPTVTFTRRGRLLVGEVERSLVNR